MSHRSTHKETRQQSHSADEGSSDASEYSPRPHETARAANQRPRGTVKKRRPYMTKKRRLAELQAKKDATASVPNAQVDTGHSASATAKRSAPPMNDKASLGDQTREVIDLEGGQVTPEPSVDNNEQCIGRGGKRQAATVQSVVAKRPRRATAANKVGKGLWAHN